MALVVDRVPGPRRGMAMGYFTAAFDLGIAAGAVVMGFVAQSVGYSSMYLMAALSALVAVSIYVINERRSVVG